MMPDSTQEPVRGMNKREVLAAGKAPRHLFPWKSGKGMNAKIVDGTAFLFHVCMEGLQNVDDEGLGGYTVMDDSDRELSRHLDAVRHAKGRVLKTGLGMGCFVRMCLTKPEVDHIDVVEIHSGIIEHFGAEFEDDPRVTIHHCDAFEFDPSNGPWDFVWHDIYCEGNDGLAALHAELITRFAPTSHKQGAWAFPRLSRRIASSMLI